MLMRIVMQVSGQVMARFTAAYLQLTTCLLNSAKRLHALITQIYLSVLIRLHQLVQMVLSFNHLRASLITAVQLIKAGLSIVKQTLIQTGLQLATTVRQTLQRVSLSQLQNKGRVVKMKWALLRMSVSKFVQILTAHPWIQAGLKLLGRVNPHRLAAYLLQQLEKGRVTLTNWVLLATKKLAAALTLMGNQLKAIGLKLQGSVHLLLQRVLRLQSLIKKRAEKTKLVQSLLKKAVAALTRMAHLLKVFGLKQVGTVRQPQQRARRQNYKGR
jgi:hypothetical protein